MSFGSKMRELRLEKNLLQKDLAYQLNMSIGTISNYEKDVHFPDGVTLCKIADLFGVSIDYLMERTQYRGNPEILNQPVAEGQPLSGFIDILFSLDHQRRKEIWQYAQYQKSISEKST